MQRAPLVPIAAFYAAGIAISLFISGPAVAVLFTSLAVGLAGLIWPVLRRLLLPLILVGTGWANGGLHQVPLSPVDLRLQIDRPAYVHLRGTLLQSTTATSRTNENGAVYHSTKSVLDLSALKTGDRWAPVEGRVQIRKRGLLQTRLPAGSNVQLEGVLRTPEPAAAPGLFDYARYLRWKKIHFELEVRDSANWQQLEPADKASLPALARDRATAILTGGLPQDLAASLLRAMALGWRFELSDPIEETFMKSGTLHVFAISGLHIGLIVQILVMATGSIGMRRHQCLWLVLPVLWFYVAMIEWPPSAVRASVMASVLLISWALRRPPELLNSLAAAALIILAVDPLQLFTAGFQLSFAVVLTLVLVLVHIDRLKTRLLEPDPMLPQTRNLPVSRWRKAAVQLISTFLISCAAWVGSLPLIAHYFQLITPISCLANLFIVPLSFFALSSAMCTLATAPITGWASEIFSHGGWCTMWLMCKCSEWFASVNLGHFPTKPLPPVWIGTYYVVLWGSLACPRWPAIIARFPLRTMPRRARLLLAAGVAACLLLSVNLFEREKPELEIDVLRSTGDAFIIRNYRERTCSLIDGGSASAITQVVLPYLKSLGHHTVDRLILTHGDINHSGGASLALTHLQPRAVLTSSVPFRSPSYRAALAALATNPISSHWLLEAGDRFGPWEVLHPANQDRFSKADDSSLVLKGAFPGCTILLLSDLGSQGQRALFHRSKEKLRADIVLVGAQTVDEPLQNGLLRAIRPSVIVGSSNRKPVSARIAEQTVKRWEASGAHVLLTDQASLIRIRIHPDGWTIQEVK